MNLSNVSISYRVVMLTLLSLFFQEGFGQEKQVDNKVAKNGFHRDYSAVYFDPVDFVEYNGLHHKLGASGLTDMLTLIHTQFDEIMVPFYVPPRQVGNLSNHDILEAAALLNKLLNGSSSSPSGSFLKLVILYKVTNWEDKLLLQSEFQSGRRVIKTAHTIFPGNVKSIILEVSEEDENFHEHYVQFREFFGEFGRQHKFGIQVDIKHCGGTPSEFSTQLENDILRDFSVDTAYFSDSLPSQMSGLALDRSLEMSFNRFTPCQKLFESMSTRKELGFMVTWPDTNSEGHINRTGLVEFWKRMNGWAGKFTTSIIFIQAFDAPLSPERVMKTNGWWRFLPNSNNYNQTSKFVFEEKQSLIMDGSSNFGESQPNMTWLSQEAVFRRELVGVNFNPFVPRLEAGKIDQFSMVPMIEQISTTFSKLLLSAERLDLDDDMYLGPVGKKQVTLSIPGALSRWNFNRSDAKRPLELSMTFDRTTAGEVTKLAQDANRIFNSTVTQLIYAPADFDEASLLDGYAELSNIPKLFEKINLGIKVKAEVCSNTVKFNNLMDLLQLYFSGDFKLKVIYFSETVSLPNTILGAERALPLLLVSFENCRDMVREYMASSVSSLQVAFMTGWPIKGDDDSVEGRIQFVRFWELLGDWADKHSSSVIMHSAFDPPAMGTLNDKSAVRYGWWGVTESESLSGPHYLFENKKQAAHRLAMEPPPTIGPFNLTYIIVPPIAFVLAFVIVTLFVVRQLRKSKYVTKAEIKQFLNGGGEQTYSGSLKGLDGPYQKGEFELSKKSFSIIETSPLGSGAFGKVCLGRVVSNDEVVREVAVKMTKVPSTWATLTGLMFEIKILAYLGKHPHIVELVGAHTAELKRKKVLLFLELCALGSLQDYMRKCKSHGLNDKSPDGGNEFSDCTIAEWLPDEMLASDMNRWSCEVASGMEFIASKHIVHLDIASRNVLLAEPGRVAKITDFGLSRRMKNYHSYKKKKQEALPWRWMAPESLRTSEFTEKSDVWGFGVLLWEIYSLGDEPYPGLSWDINFPTKLERGLRPDEPSYNSNGMYYVMLRCWTTKAEGRPSFSKIVELLSSKFGEMSESWNAEGHCLTSSNDNIDMEGGVAFGGSVNKTDLGNPTKSPKRRSWDGYVWLFLSLILLVILTAVLILSNGGDSSVGSITGNGSMERNSSSEYPNSSSAHNSSGFDKNASNVNDGHNNASGTNQNPKSIEVQVGTHVGIPDEQMQRILSEKLFMAIKGMKEKAVEALILRGAPVNLRNHEGQSPLIKASHCGSDKGTCFRIIKYLIEHGADVFVKDGHDGTFLHILLGGPIVTGPTLTPSQFHQLVIFLVSQNMTKLFNIPGYTAGLTPLNWPARTIEIQTQTLAILHQNGANFHAVTSLRRSIMMEALRGGRSTEFFDELIKLGVAWDNVDGYSWSMIHIAAIFGHMTGLKYFLKLGLNVNAPDLDGDTPIHLVMSSGEINVLEVARILVESGANVSIKNYHGRTPLEEVIRNKDMKEEDKRDLIELLRVAETEANRDIPLLSGRDSTSLGMALFNLIDRLNEDAIKILVELGADVNVRNDKSDTCLTRAASCGGENSLRICLRIIKYLINNGADVYAKDSGNHTFLHLLVSSDTFFTPAQFHGMAQFLIARNMTSLFMNRGGKFGQTPLFNAVKHMTVEVVTLTLMHDNGVNFDVVDDDGDSVLLYAMGKRSMKLLSDIVKLGANREYLNYMNQSLLHLAAVFDHLPGVKYFLEKGLDVNAQDVNGNTPLHLIAVFGKQNFQEITQLLIAGGADTTIKNDSGQTSFEIAVARVKG